MARPRAVREIVLFLTITYVLTLGISLFLPDAHINLLLTVMMPTVTVAILTFTITPRGSRRALWRGIGLGRAGRTGRPSWLMALGVPALLVVLAYGTALVLGVANLKQATFTVGAVANSSINLLINLAIGTVIILGEEIGWRGFLLPRFQQLTDRRRAAVATGFCHGCFHLPLILIASTYDTEGNRWLVAAVVVVTITAAGVFYAYLRDRSGSIWPVAVAHNVVNTAFDMGAVATTAAGSTSALALVAGESGFATMAAALAVAAFLLTRGQVWKQQVVVGEGDTPRPHADSTDTGAATVRAA